MSERIRHILSTPSKVCSGEPRDIQFEIEGRPVQPICGDTPHAGKFHIHCIGQRKVLEEGQQDLHNLLHPHPSATCCQPTLRHVCSQTKGGERKTRQLQDTGHTSHTHTPAQAEERDPHTYSTVGRKRRARTCAALSCLLSLSSRCSHPQRPCVCWFPIGKHEPCSSFSLSIRKHPLVGKSMRILTYTTLCAVKVFLVKYRLCTREWQVSFFLAATRPPL